MHLFRPSGRIIDASRAWPRDRRGNFTVMFAISAVVIIVMIGMGIDYLTGLSFKARWDTAADAAALAAVKTAEAYVAANSTSGTTTSLSGPAMTAGIAQGLKVFNANAGASLSTEAATPSVTMSVSGLVFTATASYSGSVTTRFGGLVGVSQLSVSGTSVATGSPTTFINYYIIVDTSQSMGIGATQNDESNLFVLTKSMGYTDDGELGCVFGCHIATYGRPYSNEQVAHELANPPITLRIDAAKTAIQNVIGAAQSYAGPTGSVKVGVYTMEVDFVKYTYINEISPPTDNFGQLSSLVNAIDLGQGTPSGNGDTDLVDQLATLAQNLPANGNGASASSPLNYVLIITDGVTDITGPCNVDSHCTGPLPAGSCASLQAKATVGVVYSTYIPLYAYNNSNYGLESDYSLLVAPFASSIQPDLQACASNSSLFYQATDGPALIAALQTLFASTLESARLSQ